MSLAERVDHYLERLKWPAAVVSLIAFPLVSWGLLRAISRSLYEPIVTLPFVLGVAAFVVSWRYFEWMSRFGRWVITLEHELTHAIFAWLTFHKVVSFKASMRKGGRVKFIGRGNWLITIAPYFFPTAAFVLLLLSVLMPAPFIPWTSICLGIALGFHVISTAIETHRDQTDLQQLGWTFCWLFLPTANVVAAAILIAFAHAELRGIQQFFIDSSEPLFLLWSSLFPGKTPATAG